MALNQGPIKRGRRRAYIKKNKPLAPTMENWPRDAASHRCRPQIQIKGIQRIGTLTTCHAILRPIALGFRRPSPAPARPNLRDVRSIPRNGRLAAAFS
jgi:hypothetical protein